MVVLTVVQEGRGGLGDWRPGGKRSEKKDIPCNQSAPWPMVSEQALPKFAKSADSTDGAMIAFGDIFGV